MIDDLLGYFLQSKMVGERVSHATMYLYSVNLCRTLNSVLKDIKLTWLTLG